jgi:hypothetical protein
VLKDLILSQGCLPFFSVDLQRNDFVAQVWLKFHPTLPRCLETHVQIATASELHPGPEDKMLESQPAWGDFAVMVSSKKTSL